MQVLIFHLIKKAKTDHHLKINKVNNRVIIFMEIRKHLKTSSDNIQTLISKKEKHRMNIKINGTFGTNSNQDRVEIVVLHQETFISQDKNRSRANKNIGIGINKNRIKINLKATLVDKQALNKDSNIQEANMIKANQSISHHHNHSMVKELLLKMTKTISNIMMNINKIWVEKNLKEQEKNSSKTNTTKTVILISLKKTDLMRSLPKKIMKNMNQKRKVFFIN
jgi:primosomal replication protein N